MSSDKWVRSISAERLVFCISVFCTGLSLWSVTPQQTQGNHYLSSARGQVAQLHPCSPMVSCTLQVRWIAMLMTIIITALQSRCHLCPPMSLRTHQDSTLWLTSDCGNCILYLRNHYFALLRVPLPTCTAAQRCQGTVYWEQEPQSVTDRNHYMKLQLTHLCTGVINGCVYTISSSFPVGLHAPCLPQLSA